MSVSVLALYIPGIVIIIISGKEVKIQEFVYRDTENVEPEMYDCTSNNWSHLNSNDKCSTLWFVHLFEHICSKYLRRHKVYKFN